MTENLSNNNVSNKKSSLLDSFLLETMKQYDEPQRKGTPRGESIGFSWQKHSAALLMLKKYSLKHIAETLKVSYGLIRKWRTEDQFIKQIEENESDFTLKLFKYLVKRGEKQKKIVDDYFINSVEYITRNYPPELTWNEFLDLKSYAPYLVVTIALSLPKHYEKKYEKAVDRLNNIDSGKLDDGLSNDDILTMAVSYQILSFYNILQSYALKTKKEISELTKKMAAHADKERKIECNLIQYGVAREWSKTGTISEDHLKKVLYTIHNLSGNFTPVDMDY